MIDHYALHDIQKLTDRFGITDGVPKGVKPHFNISPTNSAPVVLQANGKTDLRLMQWGLVPTGAKDANSVFRYKTFNVKSEKVFTKPAWDTAVRQQRCLIPANGFYMIRSGDSTDAYYFTAQDESLLSLAGIYSLWTDPSGTGRWTFALLTIDSNAAMPLPFGRMPVVLHADDEKKWTDPNVVDFSSLVSMMRPFEGPSLAYRRVSGDVVSAKKDAPYLIEVLRR